MVRSRASPRSRGWLSRSHVCTARSATPSSAGSALPGARPRAPPRDEGSNVPSDHHCVATLFVLRSHEARDGRAISCSDVGARCASCLRRAERGPAMYTEAALYDLIFNAMGKEFSDQADRVADLVRRARPHGRALLDVACGTGEHARYLSEVHGF